MDIHPASQTSSGTISADETLAAFRARIDAMDAEIIKLLHERTRVVSEVGAYKRRQFPGVCPIRSGREADQIRRVAEAFKDGQFSPAAAAAIWRLIIGMSASVEAEIKLSVYAPESAPALYWLAREYFGSFHVIAHEPIARRVIGNVMDGKATIGVLPMPRADDAVPWWAELVQLGNTRPHIFAIIPFVHQRPPRMDEPSGFALANLKPEATGDDMTLYVVEADCNLSQHKLQTAFLSARLQSTSLGTAQLNPASRHHLIKVDGFVPPESQSWCAVLASLGVSVFNSAFLGAYAVPVVLNTSHQKREQS